MSGFDIRRIGIRKRGIITWKLGAGFTIEQEPVLREIAEGNSK